METQYLMAHKDYRALINELGAQGWRLEDASSSNHFKAFPPSEDQKIVCFATTSGDPRAIKNTIRDLRASGFKWPPPPKGNGNGEAIPESQMPTKSADELFEELKDTKSYYDLAREALEEANEELKQVQQQVKESREELHAATNRLKVAKQRFDTAFSVEIEDG